MCRGKLWLVALLVTIVVTGVLVVEARRQEATSTRGGLARPPDPGRARLVSLPADECVTCHHRQSPTVVEQWARSSHAANGTVCVDCHQVDAAFPGAKEHYGTHITAVITPGVCGKCHPVEVRQFGQSRHAIPAWAAMVGYDALEPRFQELLGQVGEIRRAADGGELPAGFIGATRHALYGLEQALLTGGTSGQAAIGKKAMALACEGCHEIGRPNADGTAGNCNACHLRHRFSLEQVRKPETCSRCHVGPDHPQWEIYQESSHGILYATQGTEWNWNQVPGRLGVRDFPAPTCQVCHISSFGPQPTTHDVGERLGAYLFAEVSEERPNARENRQRMQSICLQCHNTLFVEDYYDKAGATTTGVNNVATAAGKILQDLVVDGLLTSTPFDQPIQFTAFDLWHYYGRTAKFGAWMQGPDYTQWHGLYPMLRELTRLRAEAEQLRADWGSGLGSRATGSGQRATDIGQRATDGGTGRSRP